MKNFIIPILAIVLLQACTFSHSHGYHAYFCTTTPSDEKRFLYIDEKKVGELPYTDDVPDCEANHLEKVAVYTQLSAGGHLVEIRSTHGEILFSEELELERRNGGSSISSSVEKPGWDTKVKIKDDMLVIELIH